MNVVAISYSLMPPGCSREGADPGGDRRDVRGYCVGAVIFVFYYCRVDGVGAPVQSVAVLHTLRRGDIVGGGAVAGVLMLAVLF